MVWDSEVNNAAAHWGAYYGVAVDPALVHGVIEKESRHGTDPRYVKYGGVVPEPGGHFSYGPMQIYDDTVSTWLHLGFPAADLATHPELGIWYGTKYLAWLLSQTHGDVARAVAAYNGGLGRAVRNAAGAFFNQAYVDEVLTFWNKHRTAVLVSLPLLAAVGFVIYIMTARGRRAA
jgi:hypothetical protein